MRTKPLLLGSIAILAVLTVSGCAYRVAAHFEVVTSTGSEAIHRGMIRLYDGGMTGPVNENEVIDFPLSAGDHLYLRYLVPTMDAAYVAYVEWRVDGVIAPRSPRDLNTWYGFPNAADGTHSISLTVYFKSTGSNRLEGTKVFHCRVKTWDDVH